MILVIQPCIRWNYALSSPVDMYGRFFCDWAAHNQIWYVQFEIQVFDHMLSYILKLENMHIVTILLIAAKSAIAHTWKLSSGSSVVLWLWKIWDNFIIQNISAQVNQYAYPSAYENISPKWFSALRFLSQMVIVPNFLQSLSFLLP